MNAQSFIATLRGLGVGLYLENGKLRTRAKQGILTSDLITEIRARKEEIIGYLEQASNRIARAAGPLKRRPAGHAAMASSQQRILWLMAKSNPSEIRYNLTRAFYLNGDLDVAALRRSVVGLWRSHEALRTRFFESGDSVYQASLSADESVPWSEQVVPPDGIESFVRTLHRTPFDLGHGPLFRADFISSSDCPSKRKCVNVFVLRFHHSVVDGWSIELLLRELSARYRGDSKAGGEPVQFADYISFQHEHYCEEARSEDRRFWNRQLEGIDTRLSIREQPMEAAGKSGGYLKARISRANWGRVAAACRMNSCTPNSFLLGCLGALVSRYTGRKEMIIGVPTSARHHPALSDSVGFYANTVPLRIAIGRGSVADYLTNVQDVVRDAVSHDRLPFEEIQSMADLDDRPLIDLLFSIQHSATEDLRLNGVRATPIELPTNGPKFGISLLVKETADFADIYWEFDPDRFSEKFIKQFASHYQHLLLEFGADWARAPADIPILNPEEKTELRGLSEGCEALTREPIPDIFSKVARQWPDKIALVDGMQTVTFEQLDRRANGIAKSLLDAGIHTGEFVAVDSRRSSNQIAALLGILKAGAAYFPLDVSLPVPRISAMLRDADCRFYVGESESPVNLEKTFDISDGQTSELNPGPRLKSNLAAYVNFSSGTTGEPKGIVCSHRGVVRLVTDQDFADFSADRVWLHNAPISFDAATLEIWGALLNGSTLVLWPDGQAITPAAIRKLIETTSLDSMWLTSALFDALVDVDPFCLEGVTQLLTGGDRVSADRAAELYACNSEIQIINGYGPTENTTFTACYRVPRKKDGLPLTEMPIGRPICGTQVAIVDDRDALVPKQAIGEIVTAGEGLAIGYLKRPELNEKSFITLALNGREKRWYKTGDYGCWRDDGQLIFLGRRDGQVKINGYRVELSEVESLARQLTGVQSVAAAVLGDGNRKYIALYFVADSAKLTPEDVIAHCNLNMPRYLRPSTAIPLKSMPISRNGKLDRKRLPKPGIDEQEKTHPQGVREKLVGRIWGSILEADSVCREDDFFSLGGHSILAMKVIVRLRQAGLLASVADLFRHRTLEAFSTTLTAASASDAVQGIESAARCDAGHRLSSAQKGLWIIEQAGSHGDAYLVKLAWRIDGVVDSARLRRAINAVYMRHEALRTRFPTRGDQPLQDVSSGEVDYSVHQCVESELKAAASAFAEEELNVARDALMRVGLFQARNHSLLVLVLHHIIADGWSAELIVKEISAIYASEPLPNGHLQMIDFSEWEARYLRSDQAQVDLQYWGSELEGAVDVLNLPSERPREHTRLHQCESVRIPLDGPKFISIKEFANARGCSVYAVLMAAWCAYLSRICRQNDIVLGTPVANRVVPGTESIVGNLVNVIPFRQIVESDRPFEQLVAECQSCLERGLQHQGFPFERLVRELDPLRRPGYSPIFQVMFDYKRRFETGLQLDSCGVSEEIMGNRFTKFDLTLTATESTESLEFQLQFCTDLYSWKNANRLLLNFIHLVNQLPEIQSKTVGELPIVSNQDREIHRVLNDTSRQFPGSNVLEPLLEKLNSKIDAPTLFDDGCGEETSGPDLLKQIDRVASHLLYGGFGGQTVAVSMERSSHLVAAVLGILRAGCAYLPIDPAYPEARRQLMLTRAGVKVLISGDGSPVTDARCKVLNITDLLESRPNGESEFPEIKADDIAYVIFTSGSTGEPKGVEIPHSALHNHMAWMTDCFGFTSSDRFLFKTAISFDASVWELFAPLLVGGTMVLADPERAGDIGYLRDLLNRNEVTVCQFVPSILEAVLSNDYEFPNAVRLVFSGGEALTSSLSKRFYARQGTSELVNLYGPTEATIDACYWRVQAAATADAVPIGRPIANVRCYVVDDALRTLPVGCTGELLIGGAGLAKGYANLRELTGQRFVSIDDSDRGVQRVYRTGDLVRMDVDGNLLFCGRRDNQIKLRGFRIELGEIESVLMRADSVAQAAAVIQQQPGRGDCILAAVVGHRPIDIPDIRKHLRNCLPAYMLPDRVVNLESMPISANGKLDRHALARLPVEEDVAPIDSATVPSGPIEEKIQAIWAAVLARPENRLSRDADFFEIGGHSLLAAQCMARLNHHFNVNVSLKAFLERPTICDLAKEFGHMLVAKETLMNNNGRRSNDDPREEFVL